MPNRLLIRALPFFPLFLAALNLLLQSLYLTTRDIGHDEPFSIYHAQFGSGILIGQLKAYNNPPLFELLLHFWVRLFGLSPLAVRSLPLLFSVLSPLALFYFGKRHFSTETGIAASLLLTASSLLLYYSHDCRVYSLFLLLSLLSMHFFLALLNENRPLRTGLCFILFTTLLIYAHYFGVFILLLQGLHLLLFYRQQLLKTAMLYVVIAIAYLPQLYTLYQRMGYSVKNGTWLQPPAGLESLYNMLWSFSNFPVLTVACIAILVTGLVFALRSRKTLILNNKVCLLLTWFLLPFFGMYFLSFRVPMFIPRYLIFVLPAYYTLLVVCLQHLFPSVQLRRIVLAVLVLCFGLKLELNPDKKQKISEAMPLIRRLQGPGTLVAVFPKDYLPTFAYHYNAHYFSAIGDNKEYHLTDSLLKADGIHLLDHAEELGRVDLSAYSTVVCLTSDAQTASVPQRLEGRYTLRYEKQLTDNLRLTVFR